ncbi:MAG: hypothetical protein M3O25_06535 [Actinomycetota bacterium]|nr:hypothetical protein [Actinomycetota bacterium]
MGTVLDPWDAVLAFVFAGSVAWMLVPAAETLARRLGAIDEPKERGADEDGLGPVGPPAQDSTPASLGQLARGLWGDCARGATK